MNELEFRARYEKEAAADKAATDKVPLERLLERVRQRYYGSYFSLWRSIAQRATLEQAGWALLEVLKTEPQYLQRYHCASALLALMGKSRAEAVHYSADNANRWENLESLETELLARVGPPGDTT